MGFVTSERYVAGRMAQDPLAVARVQSEEVTPSHFTDEQCRTVAEASLKLLSAGLHSGHGAVMHELEERVTESDFRELLSAGFSEDDDLPYHIDRIRRAHWIAGLRSDVEANYGIIMSEDRPLDEREKVASTLITSLMRHAAKREAGVFGSEVLAGNVIDEAVKSSEAPASTRYEQTGIYSIDRMVGGLPKSRVSIIAARPAHGKSAFASQIALNMARRWKADAERGQVVYFSAEVSAHDMALRHISTVSRIDSRLIEAGHLSGSDWEILKAGSEEYKNLPVTIDEATRPNNAYMFGRVQNLHIENPVRLVVFDYTEFTGEEGEKRHRLESCFVGLHEIAKRFGCPVVAVHQLSRETERNDGIPQLAHLAETSMAEKIASLILMLHYPYEHFRQTGGKEEGDAPARDEYHVFIRKNTKGGTGKSRLQFWRQCLEFHDPSAPSHDSKLRKVEV